MATTDPFHLPYTMPDSSTRRPFFDRVPLERASVRGHAIENDLAHDAYPESVALAFAAVTKWLARNIGGGVRINKVGQTWEVGNRTFSSSATAPVANLAVLKMAHILADDLGISP